jgi:hypothetical protein
MSASFKIVKQLILSGGNRSSRLFSFAGLGIGVLLLFCCVQMYFNLKQLTRKNAIRKNGFDYIALKSVTNETMGKTALNMFAPAKLQTCKNNLL